MAYNDPFTSNSTFPLAKDYFPSVVDADSTDALSVPKSYTKFWASHYNKVVNSITNIEQEINKTKSSAGVDSTLTGLSYVLRLPPLTFVDMFFNTAPTLTNAGILPATHIYPFEWVITSSSDNYSAMPSPSRNPGEGKPLFFQSQADMDVIFGGLNLYNIKPMVSVTITQAHLGLNFANMRYMVNCNTEIGNDTLLIHGCIIDTYLTYYSTTILQHITTRFYPTTTQLNCTIMGVRT